MGSYKIVEFELYLCPEMTTILSDSLQTNVIIQENNVTSISK